MLTGAFCVAGSLWFTFELPEISAIMQPIYQKMALPVTPGTASPLP